MLKKEGATTNPNPNPILHFTEKEKLKAEIKPRRINMKSSLKICKCV